MSGWFFIDWLRAFFDAVDRAIPTARFELISRDPSDAILASLNPHDCWRNRLSIKSADSLICRDLAKTHCICDVYAGGSISELGRSPTRMAEVLGCGLPVVANPGVGDVEHVIREHRIGVLAQGPGPWRWMPVLLSCWIYSMTLS